MKKAFSIRTAVCLSAILGLGLAMPAGATGKTGGGSTSCSYNVTTVIADTDSNFNNLPFQIQSDSQNGGSETYTTVNNVTSQIMKGCDWVLNLRNQNSRNVNLTFNYPLAGNNAPFAGPQAVAAGIVSNCQKDNDNTVNFGTMTSGTTLNCPMEAVFSYAGSTYHLLMDPINAAGTTWVRVACTSGTAGDGSPCTGWAVTPVPGYVNPDSSPAGEPAAIGELFQETTSRKGQITLNPLGAYYVAFSFTISK